MNERIQELAYQAEDYADGIVDQGGEFHPAYTQKLAELIVRECIRCCDDVDAIQKHYLKYGIDQELDAKQCIEVIKKHFGVE